jgi:hypothetical protein
MQLKPPVKAGGFCFPEAHRRLVGAAPQLGLVIDELGTPAAEGRGRPSRVDTVV